MEPFIPPTINIADHSSLEWRHFANLSKVEIQKRWREPMGKGLLNSLQAAKYSRDALEKNVGKFGGKFDLRGISLGGVDLTGLDLSDIDFFASDLSGASLKYCDLSGTYLSESDVRGTVFDWANLDGALLDNVKFDKHTSFLGVNLNKVNFTLATLLYDLALSQQRIQQLEQHHKLFALFLRLSCDYGRSFQRYVLWVAAFLIGYACAYWLLMPRPFVDCLYFSIVTFSTVGYGDILPQTPIEKVIVISEILIGYLMGGLLIAILAKRVIG